MVKLGDIFFTKCKIFYAFLVKISNPVLLLIFQSQKNWKSSDGTKTLAIKTIGRIIGRDLRFESVIRGPQAPVSLRKALLTYAITSIKT